MYINTSAREFSISRVQTSQSEGGVSTTYHTAYKGTLVRKVRELSVHEEAGSAASIDKGTSYLARVVDINRTS